RMYRIGKREPDLGITREDAIAGLTAAADAGHQEALQTLLYDYRWSGFVARDSAKAVEYARKLMEMPPQGAAPGASEAAARDDGRATWGGLLVMADGVGVEDRKRGFAIVEEMYGSDPEGMFVPYATAFRYGRGVEPDAARARQLAEDAVARGQARAIAV